MRTSVLTALGKSLKMKYLMSLKKSSNNPLLHNKNRNPQPRKIIYMKSFRNYATFVKNQNAQPFVKACVEDHSIENASRILIKDQIPNLKVLNQMSLEWNSKNGKISYLMIKSVSLASRKIMSLNVPSVWNKATISKNNPRQKRKRINQRKKRNREINILYTNVQLLENAINFIIFNVFLLCNIKANFQTKQGRQSKTYLM